MPVRGGARSTRQASRRKSKSVSVSQPLPMRLQLARARLLAGWLAIALLIGSAAESPSQPLNGSGTLLRLRLRGGMSRAFQAPATPLAALHVAVARGAAHLAAWTDGEGGPLFVVVSDARGTVLNTTLSAAEAASPGWQLRFAAGNDSGSLGERAAAFVAAHALQVELALAAQVSVGDVVIDQLRALFALGDGDPPLQCEFVVLQRSRSASEQRSAVERVQWTVHEARISGAAGPDRLLAAAEEDCQVVTPDAVEIEQCWDGEWRRVGACPAEPSDSSRSGVLSHFPGWARRPLVIAAAAFLTAAALTACACLCARMCCRRGARRMEAPPPKVTGKEQTGELARESSVPVPSAPQTGVGTSDSLTDLAPSQSMQRLCVAVDVASREFAATRAAAHDSEAQVASGLSLDSRGASVSQRARISSRLAQLLGLGGAASSKTAPDKAEAASNGKLGEEGASVDKYRVLSLSDVDDDDEEVDDEDQDDEDADVDRKSSGLRAGHLGHELGRGGAVGLQEGGEPGDAMSERLSHRTMIKLSPLMLTPRSASGASQELAQASAGSSSRMPSAPQSPSSAADSAASSPPPSPGASDKARRPIISEMASTEATYVTNLTLLDQQFVRELSSRALTHEQSALLFSNLKSILELNTQFNRALQERVTQALQETLGACESKRNCVGDVFVQFAPFFRLYSTYINNYPAASKALVRLLAEDRRFAEVYREVSARPALEGQTLQSLLILPVQRIPRYQLLLSELLKRTPEQHADSAPLRAALGVVMDVAQNLNEAAREFESRALVVAVQDELGVNDLVAPHRVLLRRGRLTKLSAKDEARRRGAEFEFLLFNDLLLYAKPGLRGGLREQRRIPIDERFSVRDVPLPQPFGAGLHVTSSTKDLVLAAPTAEVLAAWREALRNCVAQGGASFNAAAHAPQMGVTPVLPFVVMQRRASLSRGSGQQTQIQQQQEHIHAPPAPFSYTAKSAGPSPRQRSTGHNRVASLSADASPRGAESEAEVTDHVEDLQPAQLTRSQSMLQRLKQSLARASASSAAADVGDNQRRSLSRSTSMLRRLRELGSRTELDLPPVEVAPPVPQSFAGNQGDAGTP